MADTKQPLVVTLSGELPFKRQMVFQTGLDADADLASIHAMLDKMRVALDRQFAFGEIEIHKLELEAQQKQAEDHAKRLTVVEDNVYRDWNTNGKRGDLKLSHKQELEKQQAHDNAEQIRGRVARAKKLIADCEAKINGVT
jgi:hypothetical protein